MFTSSSSKRRRGSWLPGKRQNVQTNLGKLFGKIIESNPRFGFDLHRP